MQFTPKNLKLFLFKTKKNFFAKIKNPVSKDKYRNNFNFLRNWPRPFFIDTIDGKLTHSWKIDTELFARKRTFLDQQGIKEDWEDVDKKDKKYIKKKKEKLKENENENIERLKKHSKLIMPVLTPAYPQQSSAFNVNYSTMKIIKQTLIEG
ncbi:unnamed protein product [Meloidogyne enterolobii]|uniref:Uncharacterized protein n=1 Tax=Meloidogyne enterolobii TaxID=390850 RepID=A0ACB0YHD0_MELEN